MFDVYEMADRAEIIINGYAFERCNEGVRVSNLNNGHGVTVFSEDGELIESNMEGIEMSTATRLMEDWRKYMGEKQYA